MAETLRLGKEAPSPHRLTGSIGQSLEAGRCQHGMHMKHIGTNIPESVPAVRRNNERLSAGQYGMVFIDPHVGLAGDNGQHFLDRMRVRGSTSPRCYPLLEYAKLLCPIAGRNMHPGFDTRSPRLARLILMRDYVHHLASD